MTLVAIGEWTQDITVAAVTYTKKSLFLQDMATPPIVIVGAGPAGLIAAHLLAQHGCEVHIYDQNKAAARKFLVAGHGGFNLTHSQHIDTFVQHYNRDEIRHIVRYFDNNATIEWLHKLGIPTFIGSSGKIFPVKGIKPIAVLQAVLQELDRLGVRIYYGYRLFDFDQAAVAFKHEDKVVRVPYHKLILGLGGGSWSKTGSDATWVNLFHKKNIKMQTLQPANSGLHTRVNFSALEGQVLKNIALVFGTRKKYGEIVFTSYGIEGGPVYYLNGSMRGYSFPLRLSLDLKPAFTVENIQKLLQQKDAVSSLLKSRLKLSRTAIQLLKSLDRHTYTDSVKLAHAIKNFPMVVTSFRPIDEVISTAGGVSFEELSASLSLKKYPEIYCVGEMLDWEAPTGGYLLQACFSTGAWVADQILKAQNNVAKELI